MFQLGRRTGQEALLPLCFLIQSGPQPPGKLAQELAVHSMIFKYFAERNYKQYTIHKQRKGLQRCIFDQDIVLRSATLEAAFNLSALGLSCFIIGSGLLGNADNDQDLKILAVKNLFCLALTNLWKTIVTLDHCCLIHIVSSKSSLQVLGGRESR